MFQFTRPRGARLRHNTNDLVFDVSIHAPTRGATSLVKKDLQDFVVSIHAPTRGATACQISVYYCPQFQFTRPRGARPTLSKTSSLPPLFQFTRPRGARPCHTSTRRGRFRFNSRAHEGRDRTKSISHSCSQVSIHAPTRGATPWRERRRPVRTCFNSRAHEGRDSHRQGMFSDRTFQFTRPRGARQLGYFCRRQSYSFNSRAHEGRDIGLRQGLRKDASFNSRAHEGRDAG